MRRYVVMFVLTISFLAGAARAQGFFVTINGGLSKDMRSKTENFWKMGYNIGAHGFISLPGIAIGGRIAYHSWSADGEGRIKEYNPGVNYSITSVSGSQSMIEIVPSVRVALVNPPVGTRIDVQAGFGLFIVSPGDVTISGNFSVPGTTGSGSITFKSESLTGFGPQIALPFTIAGKIEIMPLYAAYSAKGDWYNYYALNAGIRFGM